MDYEKKYKEALERAEKILCGLGEYSPAIRDIETIFPELRESEDERIRKWILEKVQGYADSGIPCSDEIQMANKALTWLEKQKEPKPADISSLRDWKFIVDAVLTEHEGIGQYLDKPETERIAKKLQERFSLPQSKPAEWSEEDESMLWNIISIVGQCKSVQADSMLTWLKSLRSPFKPSEEQLNALNFAITYFMHETNYKNPTELRDLYDDLLKLK